MAERGSRSPPPGRRRGNDAGAMVPTPLMRTQAEQLEINQTRLEAELYQLKMLADQQSQKLRVAEFVGAQMEQERQRQPHVTYHVFTSGPPPPPTPPAAPVAVDPQRQIQALERRLDEEREQSKHRLHEATAAAKQTVNQKMVGMLGEVK